MTTWASRQSWGETAARARQLGGKTLYTLASGLTTAGVAVAKTTAKVAAAGIQTLTADHSDREKLVWARVAEVEWRDGGSGPGRRLPVVLLGYETGFQLWSLEDRDGPAELVSIRRDGAVRWLEPLPPPRGEDPPDGPLHDMRPLLAVVPAPLPASEAADPKQALHRVQLYSLRSQGYVKTLSFGSEVLAVLASPRALVVATPGQLRAYDSVTLQHTLTCMTHCPPPSRPLSAGTGGAPHGQQQQGEGQEGPAAVGAPCALGPRWLAYAADQAVQPNGSQAKAQRLPLHRRDSSGAGGHHAGLPAPSLEPGGGASLGSSPGMGGGTLTSAAVAEAAKGYAVKAGQQLAAAAAAGGSASYKYLSSQYQSWRSGAQQGACAQQGDAGVAGTVMVRDVVTRQVVCHFRAHGSALAAMRFTPDGTALATASVSGHNVNVFRIIPPAPSRGGSSAEGDGSGGLGAPGAGGSGYAVHLFRLHRGVTSAVIQSISFAPDASWAGVTSGRGTNHVFHLAGGAAAGGAAPGSGRGASGCLDARPPGAPVAAGAGSTELLRAASAAGPEEVGSHGLQPPPLEEGVAGQPIKLVAVGRAGGRSGLLGSGIAGAATQAARSVYGQQAGVLPAAAAFLPAKPASPRALPSPHLLSCEAGTSSLALMVVSAEGQLTQHALRTLGAANGAPPPINAHYPSRDDARAVAALEEEARWDICRQHGWQEREELPTCLLPALAPGQAAVDVQPSTGSVLGSPHGSLGAAGGREGAGGGAAAAPDPSWLAQAESAPAADPSGPPPLWADAQFRFYALPSSAAPPHQPHPQHQPLPPPAPGSAWSCDGLGTSPVQGSGALLGRSPVSGAGGGYLLHGAGGFGAEYSRPGSSLSSATSGAAGGTAWDRH